MDIEAPPAARLPDMAARIDRAVETALRERRVVGAVVLVAERGEPVYRRAAGWADREAARPMREDAVFLLASLTKPMVSLSLMRLVEQGRVNLADPVTRWLPDFRPALPDGSRPPISVHQLLTHTAGLSYSFLEPAGGEYWQRQVSNGMDLPGLGLEENLRRLAAASLAYQPGSGWRYSMATDVLGAVVAHAAGCALPEAVRSLVTGPLGMEDTGFSVTDPSRLVRHYADAVPEPVPMGEAHEVMFNGLPIAFAPRRWMDPWSYPSGGAGMAGTAADFLRFLEAVRTGEPALVSPSTLRQMAQAHVDQSAQTLGPGWGFGYGWAVLLDPAAAATPQSRGTLQWGGAYGHHWFIDPARQLSVVALTNTAVEGMAGQFPLRLRDAIYGHPPR